MDIVWSYIEKVRKVWPSDIKKILDYYENALEVDPSYYLIYKDIARLYFVIKEFDKNQENHELWQKIDNAKKESISKEI